MIKSRFSRSIKASFLVLLFVFLVDCLVEYVFRNFLMHYFSRHILALLLAGPIVHFIIYNPNRARKFDNEKFKKIFPVCVCCHSVHDKEQNSWMIPEDFIDKSTIHDSTRGICGVCYELFHAKDGSGIKPD